MFAYAVAGPDDAGYAIVTDRFVVLLSSDAPPETVRAVHRLLDTPAAVADAAIKRLSEPDGAERFAVVEIVDPWTQSFQVNVRGDIRVDMGGASTTRFTWPQGDQLLTGEAVGVESLLLALGGAPADQPTLPLRHGAVVANAVALDGVELSQVPAESASAAPHSNARRGAELGGAPADLTDDAQEQSAPLGDHSPKTQAKDHANDNGPKGGDRDESDKAHDSQETHAPSPPSPPRGVAESTPLARSVSDASPSSSAATSTPDSGDETGEPARASALESDVDDDTRTDIVTRADVVTDDGGHRAPPVDLASLMANAPGHLWTLTLPDGNELYAAPQIVVGRRPWRSDPDETQTYYVKAPSPHREISGKHVEFTVAGGQLSARDLNSTNGTVVESPDRAPRLLRDGNATRLDVGDILDLGEGFRIVVGARHSG